MPNPIVGDFAVSLKNLNLSLPPPRLPLPILKCQEGSVEEILAEPTEVSRVTSGNCETPLEGTNMADNGKEPQESTQAVK